MGLVVANGYGRDPTDCCDRGATVHLRFTSEGRPTQYATHSVSLSLYPSLPPSLPPSASISEWFSSRNTLLRRQLKKSERSKQFSLMPSLRPLVRSPPTKIAFAFFPSLSANQQRASSKFPEQASFPPLPSAARLRRWGSRSRDPVWALPSSQLRVGRPPGAGFGRPSPSSSQVWVLVAPLALGLGNVSTCVAKKGRGEMATDCRCLSSPRLAWSREHHRISIPSAQKSSQRSCANCKCPTKSKSRNAMTGWRYVGREGEGGLLGNHGPTATAAS